jgi:chromosome segregation ATPase
MDDKMIQAQGGLYSPEELASAYAERGDQIEELSRNNRRLEFRLAELEGIASAVTALVNWVNKDKADNVWADLEDRIDSLETGQRELRSNLEEARSDLDQAELKLDEAVDCMHRGLTRAAEELASI